MKYLLTIFVCFLAGISLAQSPDQWKNEGDRIWEEFDYNGAINCYKRALKLDSTYLDARWQLAEGYRITFRFESALKEYKQVVEEDTEETYFQALFYQALMLKQLEQYTEAQQLFEAYAKAFRSADRDLYKRAKQEVKSCQFAINYVYPDSAQSASLLPTPINSDDSELSPILAKDSTWFVASIRYSNPGDSIMIDADTVQRVSWYQFSNDSLLPADNIFEPGKKHLSNVVVSPLRPRVYYTLCASGNRNCEVYYRDSIDNGLSDPILVEALQVSGYTSTQPYPAIWKGKEVLFFASNRPRGRGGMDIWYSQLKKGIKFGRPKKLSKNVNTLGDEITPYFDSVSQSLFFSSNWHAGFGSFDVFRSNAKGNMAAPQNLGKEVNSPHNELYYKEQHLYGIAYWTSNKPADSTEINGYCCNDVYAIGIPIIRDSLMPTTEPKKDTLFVQDPIPSPLPPATVAVPPTVVTPPTSLAAFKPIELYFGNDQPDPRSLSDTASLPYDEVLQNYLVQLATPEIQTQFDSNQLAFVSNYIHQIELYAREWNKLMKEHLANDDTMIVTLSGYASPLASSSYNLILSKRRINSVYQYIQKRYADALKSNQIVIIEEPFGEQNAAVSNDDPVNGLNALQSRKVTISTEIKKKK